MFALLFSALFFVFSSSAPLQFTGGLDTSVVAAGQCFNLAFSNGTALPGNLIVLAIDFSTRSSPFPADVTDDKGSSYKLEVAINDTTYGHAVFSATAAGQVQTLRICWNTAFSVWSWNLLEYSSAFAIGQSTVAFNMNAPAGFVFSSPPIRTTCFDSVFLSFATAPTGGCTADASLVVIQTIAGNFIAEVPYQFNVLPASVVGKGSVDPGSAGFATSLIELRAKCAQTVNTNIAPDQKVVIPGNVIITPGTAVGGTLTVMGNATLNNVTIQTTAVVTIGGDVIIDSLSIQQGATLIVNGTLTVLPGSSVNTVWKNNGPGTWFMTIANFSRISGAFQFDRPVFSSTTPPPCTRVSDVSSQTALTSLVASVDINNSGCTSGGLSTGAIIGISVACGVVFVAAIVTIVVLIIVRRREQKEWNDVHRKLEKSEL